jgi:hypothetical protein
VNDIDFGYKKVNVGDRTARVNPKNMVFFEEEIDRFIRKFPIRYEPFNKAKVKDI